MGLEITKHPRFECQWFDRWAILLLSTRSRQPYYAHTGTVSGKWQEKISIWDHQSAVQERRLLCQRSSLPRQLCSTQLASLSEPAPWLSAWTNGWPRSDAGVDARTRTPRHARNVWLWYNSSHVICTEVFPNHDDIMTSPVWLCAIQMTLSNPRHFTKVL